MATGFVHLRVHSDYSIIDSIIKHGPLLDTLSQQQAGAVAITDECNLFGVIKFYKAALDKGIKPVIGVDLVIESPDLQPSRLTLLAENQTGFKNMVKLISRAYLEVRRENSVPILPQNWLSAENLEGLIGLSGAQEGPVGQMIQRGNNEQAEQLAADYARRFGEDCFFIELQRLNREGEHHYLQSALTIASRLDLPVVATNDVRFMEEGDYDTHEIRVGIHEGYTLLDESRKSRYSNAQYLKSPRAMQELFADIPAATANSVIIAKRCNVTFELGKPVLPVFEIPAGLSEDDYLARQAYEGLQQRLAFIFAHRQVDKQQVETEYRQRLQKELDVIREMGFPGYFLIVADFIQWAKDHGIPVGPGRGSGAGSLVAYALKITDIDPMPYDLLFERFLNPERVSMPDFDIDFCMEGRDRVIDYVADKYGINSVSQIITYGTMAAKAVVRDVGRVLGHPYGFVDKIAKQIPNELGIKLADAYEPGTPLAEFAARDEAVAGVVDIAMKLEGITRNVGKHAAGVVISPSTVTDFCPIYCEAGTTALVTQYDKYDVEEAGLVKFDFLGLRNLTIIDQALRRVNARRQAAGEQTVAIDQIPMDDDKAFTLLQQAQTTGVFQLESAGMKQLIKRLQPDCFEEIIALVALYRPGPLGSGMVDDFVNCKHGKQAVRYPHPSLEGILKPTYGTVLYQEQVMQIAQIMANYSLGSADILRRAMGKKNPQEMARQRQVFEEGAEANGIERHKAAAIFDLMEEFAKYGFNKSHSAAYALIAYQTAWLKAYYPGEFMAALLSSDMDNTDKVVNFILECHQLGVSIDPPHINHSDYEFTVTDARRVRYGLGAIKGLGKSVIDLIIGERKRAGPYQDIFELCRRLDPAKANRRVLEVLTYAGALDDLGQHRAWILANLDAALRAAEQQNNASSTGQADLFGFDMPETSAPLRIAETSCAPWSFRDCLQYEKQVLGMSISGHLIDEVNDWIKLLRLPTLARLSAQARKQDITLAAVVVARQQRKTRKGALISILTIDDGSERMEMMVFPELYETIKDRIEVDDIVLIEGEFSIDSYNDRPRIAARRISPFHEGVSQLVSAIEVSWDTTHLSEETVAVLYQHLPPADPDQAQQPEAAATKKLVVYCESSTCQAIFRKQVICEDIISTYNALHTLPATQSVNIHPALFPQ